MADGVSAPAVDSKQEKIVMNWSRDEVDVPVMLNAEELCKKDPHWYAFLSLIHI